MLNVRVKPTGIDWYIQQLQIKLHDTLIDSGHWNLADADQYQAYGRCYRNKKDDGYIAEVLTAGTDYKEVYWNDDLAAISFFGISGQIKRTVGMEADVHFVMFADLSKLNFSVAHRADEELREMVAAIIGKSSFGFQMTSIDLWVENVLKEYPGSRRDSRLKAVDMHPVHCFRINLSLKYNPNKNC
jgi:hypothetical protein